jgi:predicted AAA+ superfamily ATPase
MQELTAPLAISRPTLEKYVSVLENTFILKLVTPFFSNKRKELVKMPKLYYHDTGMRNQAVRQFQPLSLRADMGGLVENAVFKALTVRLSPLEELKFWRTKNGGEVDFVVEGKQVIPVEVKYTAMRAPQIPSGLRSFIQSYNPQRGVVVTRDFTGELNVNSSRVIFIPACLLS